MASLVSILPQMFIYWKIPSSWGGGIFTDIARGKNMKMGKRKGENVKEKERMWKEKVKMGSKRVK
jgi:hypothetical protein